MPFVPVDAAAFRAAFCAATSCRFHSQFLGAVVVLPARFSLIFFSMSGALSPAMSAASSKALARASAVSCPWHVLCTSVRRSGRAWTFVKVRRGPSLVSCASGAFFFGAGVPRRPARSPRVRPRPAAWAAWAWAPPSPARPRPRGPGSRRARRPAAPDKRESSPLVVPACP